MKKYDLQFWVMFIVCVVLSLVLVGAVVYAFIDFANSTYTYRTFNGNVETSKHCYREYGNYTCETKDDGLIQVERYHKNRGE